MDSGFEKISRDFGLLIARVSLGGMMITSHRLPKMSKFSMISDKFPDPLGVGSATSLSIAIFAEVFCSAFLILGLLHD